MPLTQSRIQDRSIGTRHRAALGLSEETDAIIIVVSEETAQVAVARDGMLEQAVSVDRLREIVSGLGSEGDVNTASGTGVTSPALAGG